MFSFICDSCKKYIQHVSQQCPYCQSFFVFAGAEKNIIDTLVPDCLIHRYQGSDLLEPALFLKAGKVNLKVAVKLNDIEHPITVPKNKVFQLDENILASITAIRTERHEIMQSYDEKIDQYWRGLQIYED